jgi:quercetin dioxygenase-like cupin family protein
MSAEEHTSSARLRGRVVRLVDLADYQEDSVVSHQVIKRGAGNVTLFAFDEGQELSEHTTPFDALVQVLDGEAQITIAGNPLALKEGDAVIMAASQPHAVRAVKRFKMLLTMIRT